jgi:hypothetical protein
MTPETFKVFKDSSLNSILDHIELTQFDAMLQSFRIDGWNSVRSSLYLKAKIVRAESLDDAFREVGKEILDHYCLYLHEDIVVHENKGEEIQNSFEGTFTSFTATFDGFYVTVTDQDDDVFDITFNPEYFRCFHDCEH